MKKRHAKKDANKWRRYFASRKGRDYSKLIAALFWPVKHETTSSPVPTSYFAPLGARDK